MASELKPCLLCEGEAKLLRRSGTAGRACPSKWYRERVECKVCGLTTREYKKPGAAAHSWNTRPSPAATDTGLVRYDLSMFGNGIVEMGGGAYVRADQAEELLAAERAEKERLRELLKTQSNAHAKHVKGLLAQHEREREVYGQAAQDFRERAEKAEADNAAQDVRIKELEEGKRILSTLCEEGFEREKALETKLAAAEQAARAAHETLIEINPSNYNHDDVCQLNDASVEAIFLLADILGETHGKTKEWWDERRAVMGGKPS